MTGLGGRHDRLNQDYQLEKYLNKVSLNRI